MAMTFHEFKNGMSVMDGNRCVARAKVTQSHGWIMTVYDGCWVHPRARTQGLMPGKYPQLMRIRTRPEAKKELLALVNTGKPA